MKGLRHAAMPTFQHRSPFPGKFRLRSARYATVHFYCLAPVRTPVLVLAAGAVMAAAASPVQAVLMTQVVGPVIFTMSGSTATTTPLSFDPFSAAPKEKLTAVRWVISPLNVASFSQNVGLIPGFTQPPVSYTLSARPTFEFSAVTSLTGSSDFVTLTPSTINAQAVVNASGPYNGTSIAIATNSSSLRDYFSGVSGNPTIDNYFTAYTFTSTPVGGSGTVDLPPTVAASILLSGRISLEYQYEGDPEAAAVPAPLPLLGAATAFGYSRRLRQRIKSAVRF